ncbi:MAG: hypothetical protein DRK00_04340 [Thermoprotei archaeon]|nr:MAG: hypothetical protein DRK00_04340 [Thermoprotei archaeon]
MGIALKGVAFASFLLILGAVFIWVASNSTSPAGLLVSLYTGLILVAASVMAFTACRRQERFFSELERASRRIAWPVTWPLGLAGSLLILLDLMGVRLPAEDPVARAALYAGVALGLGLLTYLCLLVVRASARVLRSAELPAP